MKLKQLYRDLLSVHDQNAAATRSTVLTISLLAVFQILWTFTVNAPTLFGGVPIHRPTLTMNGEPIAEVSLVNLFLFAPLLETAIFQFCFQSLLFLNDRSTKYSAVTVAVLFSVYHISNVQTAIYALVTGFFFASIFSRLRESRFVAFLAVVLVHSFSNLLSYLLGFGLAWVLGAQ